MSIQRAARIVCALFILDTALACPVSPALALVRFGHNVFVGGHDFSNQTYDARHRAVIHLYDRTPSH